MITSGKGGVGKTTFCANLGTALARQGSRVCLIDLDIGLNNLDVAMNIEERVLYDIVDVASGRCRVVQAIVQDSNYHTLYTLPSSQSFARHNVTSERLGYIGNILNDSFDFILIDCPAGIDDGFYKAVKIASEAIIVTTPHMFSIRDADKVMRILLSLHVRPVHLVVNRVRGDLLASGDMLSPAAASELIKCPLIGIVPEDDCFTAGLTVAAGGSRAQKAFDILAKNIRSGDGEIFSLNDRRKQGFFSLFKKAGSR